MSNATPHTASFAAVASAIALAVGVAACGGASHSVSAHRSAALAFSTCMRSHGVTNFPDPSSGGGIQIGSSSGINPASPSFQSAQSACRKLLPGGGPGRGPASTRDKEQMVAIAKCMRAHGVTGFPDPVTSPPSNITDYAIALGRPGIFLLVPKTIDVASPSFKSAATACHFG